LFRVSGKGERVGAQTRDREELEAHRGGQATKRKHLEAPQGIKQRVEISGCATVRNYKKWPRVNSAVVLKRLRFGNNNNIL